MDFITSLELELLPEDVNLTLEKFQTCYIVMEV